MNLQYFSIVMYILWLLKFFGCFFVESLPSINNKNPNILTKRPPVATTVSSGTQRHHWALVYRGIPSDLRSRPEQSHHWYAGVYLRIFDPGPSIHTTFLGLCSPGDYRQSIESPI